MDYIYLIILLLLFICLFALVKHAVVQGGYVGGAEVPIKDKELKDLHKLHEKVKDTMGDVVVRMLQVGFNAGHLKWSEKDLKKVMSHPDCGKEVKHPDEDLMEKDYPKWLEQHALHQVNRFLCTHEKTEHHDVDFKGNFDKFVKAKHDPAKIAAIGLKYYKNCEHKDRRDWKALENGVIHGDYRAPTREK